ncbi:MAG: 4-hydroxythreonine-4-phosphate dehydrogenase PdxA [Pseudomonadota bacterium]
MIAVTMGDPSGIGPDVSLLAFASASGNGGLPPCLHFGDPAVYHARAAALGLDMAFAEGDTTTSPNALRARFTVQPVTNAGEITPGTLTVAGAVAARIAIEHAVASACAGAVEAIVTCPIHKANLKAADFPFPGHTEFLAHLSQRPPTEAPDETPLSVMMLAGPALRVVPVTIHIALARVPETLTTSLIERTARIVNTALKLDFGISAPRIAIAGLNPHAGEDGHMGDEDMHVIAPAIATLKAEGLSVRGPLPADTMFHAGARETYDAALCMYHDQALIPIKTIAFDDAVNVTLGLPFVRTSPDHGTALDIAGRGKARPDSYLAALRMADAMGKRRRAP